MVWTRRTSCRLCGGRRLRRILDLGETPLANAFLKSPAEFAGEARYPLGVSVCADCSLAQLLDVIDPEVLFRNYLYVTGTSETMAVHNRAYAGTVADMLDLSGEDLVVEVASNDGSLLACFAARGAKVLGVEPAGNLAATARSRGIETANLFFGADAARRLRRERGPARAVVANNVLAHVDTPLDFLAGCASLVSEDGLVVIEVPALGDLVDRLEYDTIYHEHLCYFSGRTLLRLAEAAGLAAVRLDRVPVHGGSLRLYARRSDPSPGHSAEALAAAAAEEARGLMPGWEDRFAGRVARNRADLRTLLADLRGAGRSVAAYGAPAKGNTLLNYCGIGTDLVSYTVDRNPLKVGLYTPGMHLPVLPVEAIAEKRPDDLLVLAWNFAEEIMRQQERHRLRGGRFILPVPEPRIV